MKLFNLMAMQFQQWEASVRDYLSKTFANYGTKYGSNTIFGQLINVLGGVTQNVMSYIEDALTEQNKYTASRKRSIYALAALSGYEPSLGTTNVCTAKFSFLPTTKTQSIIIPNKTRLICSQNGLYYNIMLPQESIVMSMSSNSSSRYLTMVEGTFENQTFVVEGGELYAINVKFSGECDIRYTEVYVNNELWSQYDSVYDMNADEKGYVIKTAMTKGMDIVFGNNIHGRALSPNDTVKIAYLLHSGELGNLVGNRMCEFAFESALTNTIGEQVDGNETLLIEIQNADFANSGTNSESIEKIREYIGFNSRSLVLADAKNYKQYLSRYSFVGYNRTWSEEGSLVVNSLIMRNYKLLMENGADYFSIADEDFVLNDNQKNSILSSFKNSGQMLAGTVINIFTPELCKYAAMVYVKLKDNTYDRNTVSEKIRNCVGNFFANVQSDMYIPKSDIIKVIKENVEEVDGVDVYFISKRNEDAKRDNYYIDKKYTYNKATGTYDIETRTVYLYDDENPMLGLDSHGNIIVENDYQFPVLKGGWSYHKDDGNNSIDVQLDSLTIIYE